MTLRRTTRTIPVAAVMMLLVLLTMRADAAMLPFGNLAVELLNGLSNQPIAHEEIYLQRRIAGEFATVATAFTDVRGLAGFQVNDLGKGDTFRIRVRPFNGPSIDTETFTGPGEIVIRAGMLPVTVSAGDGSGIMANTRVELRELTTDDALVPFASALTDASGQIVFDAPGLDGAKRYVLMAQSPHDGTWKQSTPIDAPGPVAFVVGNAPLVVTLANGLSGAPLSGQVVTVRRLLADGSHEWVVNQTTDAAGVVRFDLDGLGNGTEYLLRVEPYNGGAVFSQPIDATGDFTFRLGELPVMLLAGDGSGPLAGVAAELKQLHPDGSLSHVKSATTDAAGLVVFDAPDLGGESRYVVRAQSPYDGLWRQSAPITSKGAFSFTVGNAPLRVSLVNHFSGEPLANKTISAWRIAANGDQTWVRAQTTDSAGIAVFDLDGLGGDTPYRLRTEPYNGGWVETGIVTETGDYNFAVGSLPVRLIDARTGEALVGRELLALEKNADGTLVGRKRGVTNAAGRVFFDLEGLAAGQVYVIRSVNPLGNGETYFSELITTSRWVDFAIDPLDKVSLDRSMPIVALRSPADGAKVASTGFTIDGFVNDNSAVTEVRVIVTDPRKGTNQGMALLDADSGYWTFDVPASMLTQWQDLAIRVVATDDSYNEGHLDVGYRVINDTKAPVIKVLSHSVGDQVLNSGFVVSGTVSDNAGVPSLSASLLDSNLGITINAVDVPVAPDGSWDLVVRDSEVSPGATVIVAFSAVDDASNQVQAQLNLQTLDDTLYAERLLARTTFGATPDLLAEIQASGPLAYLLSQLQPATIDDSALQAEIDAAGIDTNNYNDFIRLQAIRSMHSRRQLLEVMTWFWENHFNTDLSVTGLVKEQSQNAQFRTHALGYFRDLLQASATSPATLRYLDNHASHKDAPNENFARELLELHTLGVDGGYTEHDVAEVARVFTGWRITDNAFDFRSGAHDYGSKSVLGASIAPVGYAEGEQVLDMLAAHPSTARFICTKLLQKFVADQPRDNDIVDCAGVFTARSGHIASVVGHILTSPAFNDRGNDSVKAKTPQEFVIGALRALDGHAGRNDHHLAMRDMGMPLFRNPMPNGWPETAEHWSDSNQLMLRQQFAEKLAYRAINETNSYLDPITYFADRGVTTADGIVGYLFMILLGNDYSQTDWDTAMGVLTGNGSAPFELQSAEAEGRIRDLLALLLTYPGHQLQ